MDTTRGWYRFDFCLIGWYRLVTHRCQTLAWKQKKKKIQKLKFEQAMRWRKHLRRKGKHCRKKFSTKDEDSGEYFWSNRWFDQFWFWKAKPAKKLYHSVFWYFLLNDDASTKAVAAAYAGLIKLTPLFSCCTSYACHCFVICLLGRKSWKDEMKWVLGLGCRVAGKVLQMHNLTVIVMYWHVFRLLTDTMQVQLQIKGQMNWP